MRASIRRISAILLMVFFVVPLAALPVQAYGAIAAESVLAALDREQLGLSLDRGLLGTPLSSPRLAGLDLFASNFGLSTSVGSAPAGPVEVIIGLEGNSLAAEQVRREQAGLAPLDGDGQRAYVESLKDAQADVIATLEAGGGTVRHDYQIVFNGLAAVIGGGQLLRIQGLPAVRSIEPDTNVAPALDKSVPFIYGGKTNDELGVDGSGVTIAIIDTGIDYTHAAFGGSGLASDYAAQDPTRLTEAAQHTFPTAKVIGGTDFVGEIFDPSCSFADEAAGICSSTPAPDPDPLDLIGHGSHVSGIAAGIGTPTVPAGVAPAAFLLAVKVFGLGATPLSVVIAGIEFAADPNGDGDTSDKADVINMSLGSPYGRATSADVVATDAAVDLGIIVAASAGNAGDLPYVLSGPSAASKAISVAAGSDPGAVKGGVIFEPDSGGEFAFDAGTANFGPDTSVAVSGPAFDVADVACSPIADDLTDTIALIDRGACTFVTKVRNAQTVGAVGVIIINNVAGAPPGMADDGTGGDIVIPVLSISSSDGATLRANLPGTASLTEILFGTDRLAGFSSRGPRFVDSAVKPDITAPGITIESVDVGTGTGAVRNSGTSMSSPHVAGSAALLRELHPDWSVEEIKAVLMNTATDASPNGLPYPVSRMGAGRVQVDVAVDTESVVVPASASFGVEERDHGKKKFKVKLEVRNMGDETKKFELSSDFLFPDDDEGSIKIKHPTKIKVEPGQSKKIKLELKVDFNKLAPESLFEEYDGFLTLTETTSGGDVLRVPFHIIPIARADAEAKDDKVKLPKDTTLKFRNEGIRGTLVDIYQFGVSDPNEDLIAEGPGAPEDPDDWFDIRHTGAHAFDLSFGRILEFAMTTHGSRSVANFMETDVWIDVDGGGPDYVVIAVDLSLLVGTPFPDGRILTGVFAVPFLPSLVGFTMFVTGNDPNTAIQTIPIIMDSPVFVSLNFLGELTGLPTIDPSDPDFDYFVVTFDFETGAFDVTDTASFNGITPEIDTSPNFFFLPADSKTTVGVLASAKGGILALYLNNIAGPDQSEVIKVKVK